jgi:hypothetical protein
MVETSSFLINNGYSPIPVGMTLPWVKILVFHHTWGRIPSTIAQRVWAFPKNTNTNYLLQNNPSLYEVLLILKKETYLF